MNKTSEERLLNYVIKRWLVLIISIFSVFSAAAHGDMDKIFDAIEAPHGGRIRESGGYQLELVVRQNLINVYVARADNAAPIDLSTASAAAIIVLEGKKEVMDLKYKEGAFSATSQFSSLELATVAVVVRLEDDAQLIAKFLPRSSHH